MVSTIWDQLLYTMVMTTFHATANVVQYAQDQLAIPLFKVLLLIRVSTMFSKPKHQLMVLIYMSTTYK